MTDPNEEFERDFRFVFAKTGKAKAPHASGLVSGGRGGGQTRSGPAARRETVMQALRSKPQVMVKITSFGKNTRQVRAHLDYISRRGATEVFDGEGDSLTRAADREAEDLHDTLQRYAEQLATEDDTQALADAKKGRPRDRVTMNLMLSMPPGTNTGAFEIATREFLDVQFADHDHLVAFHDDRDHYHAHVVVKLQGQDGQWLNPRKADLLEWRQNFAAALERNGIEAQATPTYSRGRGRGGYRRDLDETRRRGTRRRPEKSPTFDAEAEGGAIQKRAEAWQRIGRAYETTGDHETAAAVREYLAEHFDHRPEAQAPRTLETPGREPTQPPERTRSRDRER